MSSEPVTATCRWAVSCSNRDASTRSISITSSPATSSRAATVSGRKYPPASFRTSLEIFRRGNSNSAHPWAGGQRFGSTRTARTRPESSCRWSSIEETGRTLAPIRAAALGPLLGSDFRPGEFRLEGQLERQLRIDVLEQRREGTPFVLEFGSEQLRGIPRERSLEIVSFSAFQCEHFLSLRRA